MDGGGAVAAADDAADGDDGDIDQQMFAVTDVPRVGERFEVRSDGADVDELGHEGLPWFGRCEVPRRSAACGDPSMKTGTKISNQGPSRQATQSAQLCALAVARSHARIRLHSRQSWGLGSPGAMPYC